MSYTNCRLRDRRRLAASVQSCSAQPLNSPHKAARNSHFETTEFLHRPNIYGTKVNSILVFLIAYMLILFIYHRYGLRHAKLTRQTEVHFPNPNLRYSRLLCFICWLMLPYCILVIGWFVFQGQLHDCICTVSAWLYLPFVLFACFSLCMFLWLINDWLIDSLI